MGGATAATSSSTGAAGGIPFLGTVEDLVGNMAIALRKFLLMEYPHQFSICLVAFCLGASMRVRPSPNHSWLHHLVLVFLTGFAGGTIIPMFFGRPPALFVNDVLVPLVCLCWYSVHFTRFGGWIQSSAVGKHVLVCLFEIYRASSVLKVVSQVATDIPAGPFYPIPLVGPILVGTLSGSMGAFMPPDRGISFLASGVPLNLQTTLIACTFYHLAANDPHLIGAYLRGLPLLHLSESHNLRAFTVFFFVAMAFLSLMKGPDYNPFAPIHKFLYEFLGIPVSPATEERLKKESANNGRTTRRSPRGASSSSSASASSSSTARVLEYSKVMVPLIAILAYQFGAGTIVPRTSLGVNGRLTQGDYLASCGLLEGYTGSCQPHYLTLDAEGKLGLFQGTSPKDPSSKRLWQSKNSRKLQKGQSEAGLYAELEPEGALVLKHTGDASTTFWASSKTSGGEGKKNVRVRVLERGAFGIFENEKPLWVSDGQLDKDLF